MKIDIKWILLIVVVAILGFTNPSKEDHINEIVNLVTRDDFEEMSSDGDTYGLIGASIGLGIVLNLFENLIETNNYILFSLSKVEKEGKSNIICYGILGNIFFTEKAIIALESKIVD